jgi:hypothetical protein
MANETDEDGLFVCLFVLFSFIRPFTLKRYVDEDGAHATAMDE